ncbi:sialoadhesin-like isoform X2 [Hypomesus transpacificus]|uniref:sialoadhesin-like isoform X2 n=1 Tax=Hypomesus transpacificus TaxID=137520 RepID=UPI001F07F860|nr:sialoadhesin-like isoform X2 [Hypomesus transpacificus]
MEFTPLCFMLCVYCSILSPVCCFSLRISPSKSQFFRYESVFLICEDQGSSAGGRVRRNTTARELLECGAPRWGRLEGSSCIISGVTPSDSGVYLYGAVILESPVLPVNQGQAVTLRCRCQTPPSNLTAAFYKDGSLVRTEAAGEMTIPAVSTSDAGLYKCRNSELGGSPESWLAVRALPSLPPSPSLLPTSPSLPVVVSLLVAGLSVSLVSLLVVLLLWKRRKERPPPAAESVYSAVRTDTGSAGASGDVTYSDINLRHQTPQKKREKPLPPEPGVIYSSVRPG